MPAWIAISMDMPQNVDDKDEEFDVDVNLDFINTAQPEQPGDTERSVPTRKVNICKLIKS